jgi:hypothetical protein
MENECKPTYSRKREIADYCLRYAIGFGVSCGTFYLLEAPTEQALAGATILGAIIPAWKWNGKRLQKKYLGLEDKLE